MESDSAQRNATGRPSRRAVVVTSALAGVATALGTSAGGAVAAPARRAGKAESVVRSAELEVRVDSAFPRIVSYTERATGHVLHGQEDPVSAVVVDGKEYTPKVDSVVGDDRVAYTLAFEGGTEIGVEIRVDGLQVDWRVTRIDEKASLRVGTLRIPSLALLSVRSDQPGAELVAARIELDKAKSGDRHVTVTADTPADDAPLGCAYAVVSTDRLAAAVETNTVFDQPSKTPGATWDNGRLWHQAVKRDGYTKAQLACGEWTHRAAGAPVEMTEPLPYATVVVTGDRNGDGRADWQDAAIAMRDIMVEPLGAKDQHLRVVPHIPFNFASQATNPFLMTLDNVKRISLATDGLRQYTLVKGYGSEGHDSAHPDYGGNYNGRAGGLEDLNTLLREGSKWNSDFAVHVNATESYPVANAFSEKLVDKSDEQWDWLDQSYRIDPRRDLVSGDIVRRFRQLRDETGPGLNTLYIDVFRESGWNSDRLQRELRDQGWNITTEWGHGLERSSLWSHWATETDYGADTSRGINSRLIRFIRNHQKDVFADKWPLLGIPRTGNFEGWVGKTDWNTFYQQIWTDSLPAKYLQAYPIKSWGEHEIAFFGAAGTVVSDADGPRTITTDGRVVYRGGTYLLPWEPKKATDPGKLYHYNPQGGKSDWKLPRGWARASKVTLYRLTDQGRERVGDLPVRSGSVTIDARADQPYVLYRGAAPGQDDPRWGAHAGLKDPGFNSGSLKAWDSKGPAEVVLSGRGDYELVIGAGAAAAVGQRLTRLAPGDYVASVQVEVGEQAGDRRKAALEVRTADGVDATTWTETSTAVNYIAADRKQNTRFQRMFTPFTVPEGSGPVQLTLRAEAGQARVRFDNVRIVPGRRAGSGDDGVVVHEDFEHVPQGWGPFVKGSGGEPNDPRTHIAQRHAPYTQRGWNGKVIDDVIDGEQSLKSRGERKGIVYRTLPQTVRFEPGRRYEVSFRYENEGAGEYAWVIAVDEPGPRELTRETLPVATAPATWSREFTAPDRGEAWVGLAKLTADGTAEFVLDGFTVRALD